MIIEYIRYKLTEHLPQELIDAYTKAGEHLSAAPECESYELAQCDDDPSAFILRIHWTSSDAHLNGFRKGPHFPPFLALIKAFIPEVEEMRHYSQTSLVS